MRSSCKALLANWKRGKGLEMNTLSSPSPAKSFAWIAAEPEAVHETIRNDESVRVEECVQNSESRATHV